MKLIDGKALAAQIKSEIAEEVTRLRQAGKRAPHLAAVLVGDDPASAVYVRNKVRSCEKCGFTSTLVRKSAQVTREELLDTIDSLNQNEDIDGFIVQLPLPPHINEDEITLAIDPKKDVDGFHPTNFGKMALGMPSYIPATPYGIVQMLERYDIPTEGKNVAVLGRSNIVGTPMSILLSRKRRPGNATVTLLHSRSQNMKDVLLHSDIVIAAIGRPNFVTADMVKEGAVIIDVGINRVEDDTRKSGYRLVGDVDFEGVAGKVSHITPVPGGVGPMTVTALLLNTLKSYQNREEQNGE